MSAAVLAGAVAGQVRRGGLPVVGGARWWSSSPAPGTRRRQPGKAAAPVGGTHVAVQGGTRPVIGGGLGRALADPAGQVVAAGLGSAAAGGGAAVSDPAQPGQVGEGAQRAGDGAGEGAQRAGDGVGEDSAGAVGQPTAGRAVQQVGQFLAQGVGGGGECGERTGAASTRPARSGIRIGAVPAGRRLLACPP
jgi:hypothetical protein